MPPRNGRNERHSLYKGGTQQSPKGRAKGEKGIAILLQCVKKYRKDKKAKEETTMLWKRKTRKTRENQYRGLLIYQNKTEPSPLTSGI